MDERRIIRNFLCSLKSVSEKAREENVSVQAIYSRIKRRQYKTVSICGTKYIVENS